jgi:hypothetical protein
VVLSVFIPKLVVSGMTFYLALCAKVSKEIEKIRGFINEKGD